MFRSFVVFFVGLGKVFRIFVVAHVNVVVGGGWAGLIVVVIANLEPVDGDYLGEGGVPPGVVGHDATHC